MGVWACGGVRVYACVLPLLPVTNLPGPFQSQMMQGTPDWLQKVINGEAVEGTPEGSGKDGEEECTVQ